MWDRYIVMIYIQYGAIVMLDVWLYHGYIVVSFYVHLYLRMRGVGGGGGMPLWELTGITSFATLRKKYASCLLALVHTKVVKLYWGVYVQQHLRMSCIQITGRDLPYGLFCFLVMDAHTRNRNLVGWNRVAIVLARDSGLRRGRVLCCATSTLVRLSAGRYVLCVV